MWMRGDSYGTFVNPGLRHLLRHRQRAAERREVDRRISWSGVTDIGGLPLEIGAAACDFVDDRFADYANEVTLEKLRAGGCVRRLRDGHHTPDGSRPQSHRPRVRAVGVAVLSESARARRAAHVRDQHRDPAPLMLDRLLVWTHRWVGIVLCLFFAMWFATGAVMIYVPFPSLSHDEVLARTTVVNLRKVTTSPAQAALGLPAAEIDRVRLIDVNGQPVYVVHPHGAPVVVVNAEDGWLRNDFDAPTAKAVAERFAGHAIRSLDGPIVDDQWIVPNGFDAYRPFYRVHIDDDSGSVVYVSARTGEILQKTTARERAWNYRRFSRSLDLSHRAPAALGVVGSGGVVAFARGHHRCGDRRVARHHAHCGAPALG